MATSPSSRRAEQPSLESYFSPIADSDSASNRDHEVRHDIIQEVSEPVSPENGPYGQSPGTSALTNMLRRSPPSHSPPDHEDSHDKSSRIHDDEGVQGRLIITSNGVEVDSTERTPLMRKGDSFESTHPDWIQQQRDIESQDLRRKPSWPKLRNIITWPRERGYDIAATVFTPKRWNRQAIWQNAVLDPIGFLPAVLLGVLLNILDALSYGMYY